MVALLWNFVEPANFKGRGLYSDTVDSLLMDTSVKRTPRVGPCLSLHPLFDSL